MSKPIVFNYSDYEKVVEENKKLKAEVANLQIRCRIAESEKPDRDCNNCKYHKADGCSRWDCEYEPAKSDLISRADAIETIASRDETDGTVKVFTGREVNEILSALPSAEQKTRWIPVSERLPENIGRYIVTLKDIWAITVKVAVYGVMPQDTHNKKVFWLYDSCYDDLDITEDVVAWMPLPEPYR